MCALCLEEPCTNVCVLCELNKCFLHAYGVTPQMCIMYSAEHSTINQH
jgi:hypothetical protein